MTNVNSRIHIKRKAADVFDFIANPENNPQWQNGMQACEITSDGPLGIGSTYHQKAKFLAEQRRELLAESIDSIISADLRSKHLESSDITEDATFLRRAFLDTIGIPPSHNELAAFLNSSHPNRRAQWIDKLLADDRYADHWVSYWQDVLAENPGILKPKLNNTGPFRFWI